MSTPTPGPLAEEAARLVEAIGAWARDTVGEVPLATSASPECQVCPFCQLLRLVRRSQPETFGHLTESSASLIAAFRSIVETHDRTEPRRSGVERIDLDGFT